MGKDKKTGMSILMPSTTRGGKELSTRPQFSPDVATDVPKELFVFFLVHHYLGLLLILTLHFSRWILFPMSHVIYLGCLPKL
jgi:hypothetical protein